MSEYSFFFNNLVQDKHLVYFWSGVNISGINADKLKINNKEYYQFQNPLFLSHDAKHSKYNNELLCEAGRCINIEIQSLVGSNEFIFLTFSKKPIESYTERVGFTFKIHYHEIEDTFRKLKNFLVQELMISPFIVENIYSAANRIYTDNHYATFPISSFGFGKQSQYNLPYAQLYITNNPDTTKGSIHCIPKEQAFKNTLYIINALDLCIDIYDVKDLIEYAYTKNSFLSMYGLDVDVNRIKKYKLYFRFRDLTYSAEALNAFRDRINCLNMVSISRPEAIVDFFAFSFIPTDQHGFVLDGIQIYQR